ncbi:MAG TPA: hypothetical protein VFF31_16205 [Blastocatellia bacterium]|nr:hypothetical protein [Blastocatellia bacterium]
MMRLSRSLVDWSILMAIRAVVFLSKLKPGSELQLTHDLPFEFPSQALSKIEAIKRVSICEGSGFFAAVVDYEGDFEKVLQRIPFLLVSSIVPFQDRKPLEEAAKVSRAFKAANRRRCLCMRRQAI